MFKSYIVFPTDTQPTIAQAKMWNAHMHELKRVHWGTERCRPDVLAAELETESLQNCTKQFQAFNGLISTWLRQGVEIRDEFDFVPDRDALRPVKEVERESHAEMIRMLPAARVSFWEPRTGSNASPAVEVAQVNVQTHGQKPIGNVAQHASRVGPWLIACGMAVGTIAVGVHLARELKNSGLETRRETIERIEDSSREKRRLP